MGARVKDQPRLTASRDRGLQAIPDRDVFSHITHLASTMFNCPIALLSVIEQERHWFLGRTRADVLEVLAHIGPDCEIVVS